MHRTSANKVIVLLALLSLLAVQVLGDSVDELFTYDDFMRIFERDYVGEEKIQHEAIFEKNYAEYLKRVQDGEDVQIQTFLDWNSTQLEEFFNYHPERENRSLSAYPLRSGAGNNIAPTVFDWRTLGRVSPIKNQGSCGSCWSFSATAQYESLLAIEGGFLFDLAEQYAMECERLSSNGCQGGYPPAALSLFNTTGVPLETAYPYQPSSARYYSNLGRSICVASSSNIKLKARASSIKHYTNLTVDQIHEQLVANGPITVAVYAGHSAFYSPSSSGLINSCPTGSVDHAVLLVGYNTTHWFIKNSWGPNWGDRGFGYILKTNDCKLTSWVDVMVLEPTAPSPTPTPTSNTTVEYTVTLGDTFGDGWNGNILAFRQNDINVALFGAEFMTGRSFGPLTVKLQKNIQTQIVVAQLGTYTGQISFIVRNSSGAVVFSRVSGVNFGSSIIFFDFCPSGSCPVITTVQYTVSLTDTYGDGWNRNVLAFRQNTTIQTFGQNFTVGTQGTPLRFTFKKGTNVSIVVNTFGADTSQIGFAIRNARGDAVFTRLAGTKFAANTLLGTFCPECTNVSPVKSVAQFYLRDQDKNSAADGDSEAGQLSSDNNSNKKKVIGLAISTGVLGALAITLAVLLAISIKKHRKIQLPATSDGGKSAQDSSVEKMHHECPQTL